MKKIYIVTALASLALIAVIGIFYVTNKTTNNSDNTPVAQKPTKSELEQIRDNIKNGAILVDVRTSEEFASEHARGSVNLQLSDIQNGITPTASKETTIYLYCRSGKRAAEAKAILEKEGFTEVVSITSLDKWKSLGGETDKAY
jgi:rhodanese-related sulfurtransferase